MHQFDHGRPDLFDKAHPPIVDQFEPVGFEQLAERLPLFPAGRLLHDGRSQFDIEGREPRLFEQLGHNQYTAVANHVPDVKDVLPLHNRIRFVRKYSTKMIPFSRGYRTFRLSTSGRKPVITPNRGSRVLI